MKIGYLSSIPLLMTTIVSMGTRAETEPWVTMCKDIIGNSPTVRLKRILFCDYDPTVRPTLDHRNATTVTIGLLLKRINFDDYSNIADIHTWTVLKWRDAHLTWEPEQHNDIKLLHVKSEEIWMPSITVNNAGAMGSDSVIPYTDCWLSNEGNMYCVPSTMYSVPCYTDYVHWPYDFLYCPIELNSWVSQNDEITFSLLNGKGITLNDYRQNPEWDLLLAQASEQLDMYTFDTNFTTESLIIEILMERNSMSLYVIFIAPVVVLVVMTLASFWLHPKSSERLLVSNLNFICHLLCIHDLHWRMPDNGSEPPFLLLFYEDSLILATVALLLTTILPTIQRRYTEPPTWISSMASNILRSRAGQILLLSILDSKASAGLENNNHQDDGASLLELSEKGSAWDHILVIIGWLAFFAALVVYTVLLAMYFPVYTMIKLF